MRSSMGIEQAYRKRVELESELRSIGKKERALRERIRTLEERLTVQELEEKLRVREFPILCGEKAIEALHDFIDEIEERKGEELTDRQVDALKELANGLIISIKADTLRICKRTRAYIS